MITTARRALYPAILLAMGLSAAIAQADIAEVVDAEGNKMTFEYEGEQLRINMGGQDSYMLLRDKSIYVVTDQDGEVMVIDLKQTMSMFGNLAKSAVPDMANVNVESLQPTGRKESVAGIDGEVYLLKFVDHEGKRQEADLVLSPDRRAVGFRDAMHRMAATMGDLVDQQAASDKLQNQLGERNLGVLRYGSDMRVAAITETRVDAARFVLPAEPTDLSALGGLLGGGSGGSGGFMSGILGGGASDKSDKEGDETATNPIENAGKEIGKAFGKLFGN
jgi:hypothetical protein